MKLLKLRLLIAGSIFALSGTVWIYFVLWKPNREALRILTRMDAVYASCHSLRERIDVTTGEQSKTLGKRQKVWVANLTFARPASLRYEFDAVENGKTR